MKAFFRPLLTVLVLALFGLGPSAVAQETAAESAETPAAEPAADTPAANPQVVIETNKGKIVAELYPGKAPKTVENFLAYVESGFYDGTVFHRVIPGFMVQGGGFTQDLVKKDTRPAIENEADNGLRNGRGTLAMARTNAPHSATAQFFINLVDNGFLDFRAKNARSWGYAVFGKVTEGLDVVDAIATVSTGSKNRMRNVPVEPVIITKVSVRQAAAE